VTTITEPSWRVTVPEGRRGAVAVERFTVERDDIEALRLSLSGRGCQPGTYTKLTRNGQLWMSDTTAEQRDHWRPDAEISRRGGRVLIAGLGLGMIVARALSYPNVEHVDVVEIDRDLVDLVGPHYEGPRCTVHHADAYAIKWAAGTRWSVAWFDIWAELSEDNLPEMARLARSYGRRADWTGFWGKDEVLAERRRTADAWWRR
jgi:hypothetical protein